MNTQSMVIYSVNGITHGTIVQSTAQVMVLKGQHGGIHQSVVANGDINGICKEKSI